VQYKQLLSDGPIRKALRRAVGALKATSTIAEKFILVVDDEADARVDVLLTDLAMTGDELARQMRRRHPDLKVLYLTGYADRLFAEKQVLWEGEAFLEKPATPRGLIEAIEMLVSGKFETPRNTADNTGT
jgi:two-component system cell cycle sensor histidine kinase/response regulator CckA